MTEFAIVVHQLVRYTFTVEADTDLEALDVAEEMVATGSWPDDTNEIIDENISLRDDIESWAEFDEEGAWTAGYRRTVTVNTLSEQGLL